ncbi:MAG: ROK family protein [Kiritimatiellia bacterium]
MQNDQDIVEMNGWTLALDIGGCAVKSGLVSGFGDVIDLPSAEVDSYGSADAILNVFEEVLRRGLRCAESGARMLAVAFPGPFDYRSGVSLMIHKYAALRGLPLKAAWDEVVPELRGMQCFFCHDAHAFLAGEMWLGAGRGADCCLGVVLGTGIGVACWRDGGVYSDETGAPAADVSVWARPFKDGRVEDYVSTRALVANYRLSRPGFDVADGAKGVAEAARAGSAAAAEAFARYGKDLAAVLAPVCAKHVPQRVIIGGRIAGAFDLFGDALRAAWPSDIPPPVAGILDTRAALAGSAWMANKGVF